jgi:electron transfer flavoprotein alpha subunit
LRIASLVKQIPDAETLTLGPDGRLVRRGLRLEMNAYCRRAVSKGVELARDTGGTCTVFTLGPPSAEDVLREAIAWGADDGILISDPALAGSDTLATARALAAALAASGPFDLILAGRNSVDGDTGQVGPEVAQLLDLPFATGVRVLSLDGETVRAELETDDGVDEVDVALPAVLSVAERLCEPCKVDPEGRAAVAPERIAVMMAAALGPGPWGDAGSPTKVGAVRPMTHTRDRLVFAGDHAGEVEKAVDELVRRGALSQAAAPLLPAAAATPNAVGHREMVAVVVEHDRLPAARELIGAARRLADEWGGTVTAVAPEGIATTDLGAAGADHVVVLTGSRVAEDVAATLLPWLATTRYRALLAPSTAYGREVASRLAAARGDGLIGDAVALDIRDDTLVAAKPAFAGALVADITSTSALTLVTVRPGVLPLPTARQEAHPTVTVLPVDTRQRVRVLSERRNDDVETLARARTVIGVGAGVAPDEFEMLSPLAAVLGAELGATRKVTDKGWAPRARQIGLTGRALSPRLYVAVGLSGKFNHMVGIRSAGTIVAINEDIDAPVFSSCDIGLVGDWHQVVPLLTAALRTRAAADLSSTN